MSDSYVGEIRRFPYDQMPDGWLPCDGQSLPVAQYGQLHELIGNTFGGETGGSTFQLPNLQGAIVVSQGGDAGPFGQNVFAPGTATLAYQTLCFAINAYGIDPPVSGTEGR